MRSFLALAPVASSQRLFLSSAGCPGGSLAACIDQCPVDQFQSCVRDCQAQCGGAPTPAPPAGTCSKRTGGDCLANDIGSVSGYSADDCCAACQNNPECGAAVFVQGGQYSNTCFLKSSCNPTGGCSGDSCTAVTVGGGPSPSPLAPTPPAPTPPAPTPPAPTPPGNQTCTAYAQGPYAKCNDNCGSCVNAGARAGVLCHGGGISATGYLCPPVSTNGGDMAFACMDWTLGSKAMQTQEAKFRSRTRQDVLFGVGTFGSDDAQKGIGYCVRMRVEGVKKDIIAQSINTGSDVSGNQFDLQVGDGGAGLFDACVGGSTPGRDSMYAGTKDAWGHQYGGVDNRSGCAALPRFPVVDGPMRATGDDLVSLCEYSFDQAVRMDGGHNPSILSIGRVQCPEELVHMTQMQRNDDPHGYVPASPVQAAHACHADIPNVPLDWCLTRMMDCRKPSGAWRASVKPELMVAGRKLVQTCTSDGYTRIDNQCGCFDCDC